MKAKRCSNIELLRVIAMCMIIGLHFFSYCKMADADIASAPKGNMFYHIAESLCICGVNLFVLITGYFSVNHDVLKLRKIANLFIDVAFWGSIGFILSYVFGWEAASLKRYIQIVIPYLWGYRWFVTAYIILLLLIPYINKCLQNISREGHRILLIIFTILFCIWPSFLPSPPVDNFGYGFVHFVYLYIIASYIKIYVNKYPLPSLCLVLYVVFTFSIYILVHFHIVNTGWAYNNLFVVLQSVSLFLCFVRINIDSKVINILASCTFGIFLIHTDSFWGKLIYGYVFQSKNAILSGDYVFMTIIFISCIISFYIMAFALEYIKQFVFRHTVDRLLSKNKTLNKRISI